MRYPGGPGSGHARPGRYSSCPILALSPRRRARARRPGGAGRRSWQPGRQCRGPAAAAGSLSPTPGESGRRTLSQAEAAGWRRPGSPSGALSLPATSESVENRNQLEVHWQARRRPGPPRQRPDRDRDRDPA